MKKLLIIVYGIFTLLSCKNQTLDLSQIKINEDSREYHLDKFKVYRIDKQNGHYEVKSNGNEVSLELIDNGERVTNYIFMEHSVSQINFAQFQINPTLGAKVVDYNGKIRFISANIESSETEELIIYLLKSLGEPSEIKTTERMEETMSLGAAKILFETLPAYTRKQKSEFGNSEIRYPQHLIWNKEDVIYQLTLEPSNNLVSNSINIIAKKALKDKVIMGFHNPEKDSLLNKYLK